MSKQLLRWLTSVLISIALATGALTLAAVPARAASFGVGIKLSATRVTQGTKVTVSGKVTPKPSSRYVYLQQRNVGTTSWRTIKKVKASSSGSYKVTVTTDNDTDRYYRVYKPKQGKRKAGYSAPVQVIVDPSGGVATPPAIGISPAIGPLSGGQRATLTGSGLSGATTVTFTPRVSAARTKDRTGILPEVPATELTVVDDTTVQLTTPAGLGGENLVKVYTAAGTLTATYTYAADPRTPSGMEQAILDELNLRRAQPQTCHQDSKNTAMPAVAPIAWDGLLGDVALSHSKDLATRRSLYPNLTHTTYGTAAFRDRLDLARLAAPFGEILAVSPGNSSAAAVVDQWMASTAGHCESVMSKSWTKAGVGVASGLWGSQQSIWSNVDFQ